MPALLHIVPGEGLENDSEDSCALGRECWRQSRAGWGWGAPDQLPSAVGHRHFSFVVCPAHPSPSLTGLGGD